MQLEINLIFIDEDEKGIYNVYTLGGKQDVPFFTVIESIIG